MAVALVSSKSLTIIAMWVSTCTIICPVSWGNNRLERVLVWRNLGEFFASEKHDETKKEKPQHNVHVVLYVPFSTVQIRWHVNLFSSLVLYCRAKQTYFPVPVRRYCTLTTGTVYLTSTRTVLYLSLGVSHISHRVSARACCVMLQGTRRKTEVWNAEG